VWGGESPSGFDCSGLVQYVYGRLGVDLPRTAAEQARVGQPVAGLADARPGDLLAFHDPVDHIGIYAGNGLMVVAPKTGDVVKVQNIYEQPTAIRRILPPGGFPATGLAFDPGGLAAQRTGLLAALSVFAGAAA
jgi:cell wall-associated NlpC family hydrolase